MDDIPFQKLFLKIAGYRRKIILTAADNPVRHGCPGKSDAKLFPFLLLTVKGYCIHILLVHDMCHTACGCKGMVHKGFGNRSFVNIGMITVLTRRTLTGLLHVPYWETPQRGYPLTALPALSLYYGVLHSPSGNESVL